MSRLQKDPLRPFTASERVELERVSRSDTEPAGNVARAKELLVVSQGCSYTDAAYSAGRQSGDAVSLLVGRFNREGLRAIRRKHGGGQPKRYKQAEQERILREVRRKPERETDGTGTWSLTTLQRALRRAPDGLPEVSTYTILGVLHDAGLSWQQDRSWCETGRAVRKRKDGNAVVRDPDTIPKKT